MSDRAILRVKFTLAGPPGGVGKALGGFLRYVQYRDKHEDSGPAAGADRQVEGMLKYVAHRDRGVPRGRLFGAGGVIGDSERRELTSFVAQSIRATAPVWGRDRQGERFDRRRAVYRFVISPETARGLDLQRLTRSVVAQLETDLGGSVRWIAAEHRNTQHPHVHLVVAGIRENGQGRMTSWMLSGPRLARMKGALALEIERQRGHHRGTGPSPAPVIASATAAHVGIRPPGSPERSAPGGSSTPSAANRPGLRREPRRRSGAPSPKLGPPNRRPQGHRRLLRASGSGLHRLAARYRRDLEREAEADRRARELERAR